jgi:hypothetical protein
MILFHSSTMLCIVNELEKEKAVCQPKTEKSYILTNISINDTDLIFLSLLLATFIKYTSNNLTPLQKSLLTLVRKIKYLCQVVQSTLFCSQLIILG